MRRLTQRVGPLLLAVALLTALAPAAASAVSPDLSASGLASAEQRALTKINAQRTKRGLAKLRLDPRMAAVAQQRADYMANNDRFSHTHSGGRMAWDLMTEAGIKWYGAGEIIARNDMGDPLVSANSAVKSWMGSAGHKAQIISKTFNYIGIAVAISPSTGLRYWAGVFLRGPDRTGATVKLGKTTKKVVDATHTKVTFRWTGKDVKLQALTSGFKYFQTQRRVDGGAWYDYGTTKKTSKTKKWTRGHTYEFRVRARDKAGNWGGWKVVKVKI